MNILEIAKSITKNPRFKFIGIRPGEKLHETMISEEDSFYTMEYKDFFKIIPNINNNPNFIIITKQNLLKKIFLILQITIKAGKIINIYQIG